MSEFGLDTVECWIFDLDNTLYPPSADLFGQIDKKMTAFIRREIGVSAKDANTLRHTYWQDHGTTMAGLRLHHDIEPEHFLSEVHDIDYSVLTHDPALAEAVRTLPGQRLVHTNGPRCHANAVLRALGYADLFEAVFALEDADLISKPHAESFNTVHSKAGIRADRSAMIEDDPRNLSVPHSISMRTIWLDHHSSGTVPVHVHHRTDNLTAFLQQVSGKQR